MNSIVINERRRPGKKSVYTASYMGKKLVAGCDKHRVAQEAVKKVTPSNFDLVFENHGSLWLCRPMTIAGKTWLQDTSPADAQFMGEAMAVEPRYVEGVHTAAELAGLTTNLS